MSSTQIVIDPADLMNVLLGDADGSVRDEAVRQIVNHEKNIKKKMNDGVSPDEYRVLKKIHEALEQSSEVVKDSWSLIRKSGNGEKK